MMKSPSAAFRRSAAALEKEISKKRAPRQVNTRKRIGEWESAIADAQRMELLQDRLLALAELWDKAEVPDTLKAVTTKAEVETLIRQQSPAIMAIGNPDAGKERPEDTIRRKELALGNIPGFFPTPQAVINKMLKYMDVQPGDRVLEPSAGRGDLVKAVLKKQPEAIVDCVEWNWNLREILLLKGLNVVGDNILEYPSTEDYRWVIMNPPFENAQDAQHVRHVYENHLAPGGILVAITSNSIEFHKSKPYEEFRTWLTETKAKHAALPPGSFQESDNSTGVATRLLVVGKPDAAGNWPLIEWDEESYVPPDLWKGDWVQHNQSGKRGHIVEIKDGKYQVELEITTFDELRKSTQGKAEIWKPSECKKINFNSVSYHMLHLDWLHYQTNMLSYINMRNMKLLGYGDMDLDHYILGWAANRVDLARRLQKNFNVAFSELFLAEECRPDDDKPRDNDSLYSQPPQKADLDNLVEQGYLNCHAEHYYITQAGVELIGRDWKYYQPHIESALLKLEQHIMAVEVLAEAIAILQSKSDSLAEEQAPQLPEVEAPAPERVYVPHMQSFGTIRHLHGSGGLIGVMLDNGIYMQTLRAFTTSVETAIYNEESAKFPLTNREALQTAETPKTLQLSLF